MVGERKLDDWRCLCNVRLEADNTSRTNTVGYLKHTNNGLEINSKDKNMGYAFRGIDDLASVTSL